MSSTLEDNKATNENQPHDDFNLLDLPIQASNETGDDHAEEIKGGGAILYGRKSGDDKRQLD